MYGLYNRGMEHITNLFGQKFSLTKKGMPQSERAELIKYFVDHARDKNNKPFKASFIGYKLSHLKLEDLYSFKSMLVDRSRTQVNFNWNKTFWGMLK